MQVLVVKGKHSGVARHLPPARMVGRSDLFWIALLFCPFLLWVGAISGLYLPIFAFRPPDVVARPVRFPTFVVSGNRNGGERASGRVREGAWASHLSGSYIDESSVQKVQAPARE
jgi:hypothetical protein